MVIAWSVLFLTRLLLASNVNYLYQGCSVTQANNAMRVGLALASNTETSSLAAVASTTLLTSPRLPELLRLNSLRLLESYSLLTSLFRKYHKQYIPVNSTPFLFVRLVTDAATWGEESAVISLYKEAGVNISSGKAYHVNDQEKGWARVTFALGRPRLIEAIKRMEVVLAAE
jgi:hypothetical protein